MNPTHVDVAPFRAIINRKIRELGQETVSEQTGLSIRGLRRIQNEYASIQFDTADLIVTRLLGPMAWWEEEQLRRIYRTRKLRNVDWAYPVSDHVANRQYRILSFLRDRYGSIQIAAEKVRISKSMAGRILEEGLR